MIDGQNFEQPQGGYRELNFYLLDEAGDPLDLTSVDSIVWVVDQGEGSTPAIEKALGDGIVIVSPTGGHVRVTLLNADTFALEIDLYRHEMNVSIESKPIPVSTGRMDLVYSSTAS